MEYKLRNYIKINKKRKVTKIWSKNCEITE